MEEDELVLGKSGENIIANNSALMLEMRDMMVPSMLDPAFEEEDCLSQFNASDSGPGISLTERKNAMKLAAIAVARREQSTRFMAPIVK